MPVVPEWGGGALKHCHTSQSLWTSAFYKLIILCACTPICAPHGFLERRPEAVVGAPGTGVTDGCGSWELNLDPDRTANALNR